jgi:hypothetical protein
MSWTCPKFNRELPWPEYCAAGFWILLSKGFLFRIEMLIHFAQCRTDNLMHIVIAVLG